MPVPSPPPAADRVGDMPIESGQPLRQLHTAIKLGAMAYLKPPWFVRKIFNRVAMATGVGNSQTLTYNFIGTAAGVDYRFSPNLLLGIAAGYTYGQQWVDSFFGKGWSNTQPQHIPVVVPEVGGVKYLVSTRGEAEWVRNVRADPNVKLGDTKYVATEVPVADRAPIIAAYRPLAGKVVEGYWKELPSDADHPTFALTPG